MKRRSSYNSYTKAIIRAQYPVTQNREERQQLADELGIGSVNKLYNLASRLGATGRPEAAVVTVEVPVTIAPVVEVELSEQEVMQQEALAQLQQRIALQQAGGLALQTDVSVPAPDDDGGQQAQTA